MARGLLCNFCRQMDTVKIKRAEGGLTMHEVMTAAEAAEYLRLHVKTLCRLARMGKVPACKVGNEWRFVKETLDRWLRTWGDR
jgi:excisionase family DNA binding protein